MFELYPHQIAQETYLISNNGGAVYSAPRTGKTFPTIRAISTKLPALVICPKSVIASWFGCLVEDGVAVENITIVDSTELTHLVYSTDYTIVNYEKILKMDVLNFRKFILPILQDDYCKQFKSVVFDESYKLASFTSKLNQYLMNEVPYDNSQMRIVLTGTPICETPLDVVQSFIWLHGSFFNYSNPFAYRNVYYEQKYGYKWTPKSRLHESKVKQFVKDNSFQVQLEDLGLGGKIMKSLQLLELSELQRKLYKWVAITSTYVIGDETREMYAPIRTMFWQKIASGMHPLTNEIIDLRKAEHIADCFEDSTSEAKFLVLTRFTKIIPAILEVFRKRGISCAAITGATSIGERHNLRMDFQDGEKDSISIIVGQVDSVARGLDFSKLDTIFYYNNAFGFETRQQSELRGQNVKRKTPYEVVDLAFAESIDCHIRDLLIKKNRSVQHYIKQIDSEMLKLWSRNKF